MHHSNVSLSSRRSTYEETSNKVINACLNQSTWLLRHYNDLYYLDRIYDSDGFPLLHIAILNDKPFSFRTILSFEYNLEVQDYQLGASALNIAAMIGDPYYVNALVEQHANVNQRDYTGYTPLANALYFKHYNLVDLFLKLPEVDVNIPTIYGDPPILLAFLDGREDIVLQIMEHPQFDLAFTELALKGVMAPELSEFISAHLPHYDFSLVEAYEQAKIFGLKYDLGQCMNFKNINTHEMGCFEFDAYFNELGKRDLANSFLKFYDDIILSNSVPVALNDIFTNVKDTVLFTATHESADAFFKQIQAGKVVLLPSGWQGHSVVLVIHNDKLYICNRGDLSDGIHGIIEYHISQPKKLTVDIIEKILIGEGESSFIQEDLHNILGLEKIGEVENPTQLVGNCVWTSLETGVEAVFLANFIEYGFGSEQSHQLSKESFALWEEYDLNASLKIIIENEPNLAQHGLYGDLLFSALAMHHDSTNIFDLQKGVVILDQFHTPEYINEFYNKVGQYVIQYEPSSYYNISYMADYTTYSNYLFHQYVYNGMNPEDKIKGQEYFEFLKACDQYQQGLDNSIIDLKDVLNMSMDNSLDTLIEHAFHLEPAAPMDLRANVHHESSASAQAFHLENPHVIRLEHSVHSIESFA